ncbi:Rubrerythrin [Enhygromyxa salina]|uniref:Rubrerythrin n=1 Tax=Enhygromyxa salina TaxID=215803 RepID=A0A2S9YLD1_9BACT|nr:acyl-ACP desaturase [Enhygromyxa salina]PRQ05842.1 Rubrerythrin [Enhygromyxa salina]
MTTDLLNDGVYYQLYRQSERGRWNMSDIPFDEIDDSLVNDFWLAMVREIARSELTTFDAVRQFFELGFVDDPDFGQWLATWFFEETRHPQALMQWLDHFGVKFEPAFMTEGRQTFPFMKARMGTLTMNIISEMMASFGYGNLAKYAPEPVLATIARLLARDEARHATHFLAYAKRHLERASDKDAERKIAVQVLFVWRYGRKKVQHPIGMLVSEFEDHPDFKAVYDRMGFDDEKLLGGICRVIENLVELPLSTKAEVSAALRKLSRGSKEASSSS